jgi:recombinational DNA repair protein (RecF pathway)
MSAYVPLPRRCTDCGAVDQIVMIETACGDALCGRCWSDTTQPSDVRQPATPWLDRHIARVEAAEQ